VLKLIVFSDGLFLFLLASTFTGALLTFWQLGHASSFPQRAPHEVHAAAPHKLNATDVAVEATLVAMEEEER
jgi:hypothetical protein